MPIRPERLLISSIVLNKDKIEIIKSGFKPENMVIHEEELRYLLNRKSIPSPKTFLAKFPGFRLARVPSSDTPELMVLCRNRKLRSDLVKITKKTAKSIRAKESPKKISLSLERDIRKTNSDFTGIVSIDPFTNPEIFLDSYDERRNKVLSDGSVGIPYGFKTMDKFTGGMQDKELISIVSRTGVGKTFFMCNAAAEAILSGHKVLYCTLEMPWQQIFARLVTILSRRIQKGEVDTTRVLKNSSINLGKISSKKMAREMKRIKKYVKGNIEIVDISNNFSILSAGRMIEKLEPDIAFFDYFGLATGGDDEKLDNWQQAADASHDAKRIAMENGIPFVLGAQLNRGGVQSPTIDNIAITDAIGQDSDKIFILTPRSGGKRLVANCAKFRGGESGWSIRTSWNVDVGEIEEIAHDDGGRED